MSVELRVWTNGNELVIAPDVAGAAHQWHLRIGDDPDDYDFTWKALEPAQGSAPSAVVGRLQGTVEDEARAAREGVGLHGVLSRPRLRARAHT